MSRRSDALKNRTRLIHAAREAVIATASTDITIRDITSRARLSTATLYRHFDSKNELIDAVSVERWRRLTEVVYQVPRQQPALYGIMRTFDAMSRMTTTDAPFIAATGVRVGRTPDAIAPYRDHFEPLFLNLWDHGIRQGVLRRGTDARDALEIVGALRDPTRRLQQLRLVIGGICPSHLDVDAIVSSLHRVPTPI